MRLALVAAALALPGCADETLTGYATQGDYTLIEMAGAAPTAPITLRLDTPGRITGTGPCNTYSATQTAPYPWFAAGPIAATRRACPDLAVETAYFTALTGMTLAEVSGAVLILSNDAGETLVFSAAN